VKRCGLLGRSLAHSYSPAIHAAFGGYLYDLFEVEPENLVDFMQRSDLHGFNVTIPYKLDVIPYCTELSRAAQAIGSVNTVLRRADGSLLGDNTDAYGFSSMVHRSGIDVCGKKVLILGGGGSSLTALCVMRKMNAGQIIAISRGGENNYENISRHHDAEVIINTTPVGMFPNTGISPVNLRDFKRLEGVLDLIYNPARTRLLLDAEEMGILSSDGLVMLVAQARAAAELFRGEPICIDKEITVTQMLRRQMENLILIGMPGCGKSTVGQHLAQLSNKAFIDADHALEEAVGLTIPEIFEREGEAGFRMREIEILKKLGRESGLVIATGGGCVTRTENYAYLRQNGTIIFLERDIAVLERDGRPLSQGSLQRMYLTRMPLYNKFADIIIDNNDTQPLITAQNIMEALHENTCD